MNNKSKLLLVALLTLATTGIQQVNAGDDGGLIEYNSTSFSHEAHGEDGAGFDCDSCHDGIFEMEAGSMVKSPGFSMGSIYDGEFCGSCHDGDTAFSASNDCTSCHRDGGEILYTEPVKSVIFSHKTHTEAFDCAICHDGMFTMEALAAQKNDDFTMDSLYKGKYCGVCHDGETAFASNTQCATCHEGVKGYDKRTGNSKKSH